MTMTRTYAAKRLLEHGPLTFPQFTEVTGWKPNQARAVMLELTQQGDVNMVGKTGSYSKLPIYALASSITVNGLQPLTGQRLSGRSTGTTSLCRGLN